MDGSVCLRAPESIIERYAVAHAEAIVKSESILERSDDGARPWRIPTCDEARKAGDLLVDLGLWERNEGGSAETWWYRPLAQPGEGRRA